jgi:hypothetical protein
MINFTRSSSIYLSIIYLSIYLSICFFVTPLLAQVQCPWTRSADPASVSPVTHSATSSEGDLLTVSRFDTLQFYTTIQTGEPNHYTCTYPNNNPPPISGTQPLSFSCNIFVYNVTLEEPFNLNEFLPLPPLYDLTYPGTPGTTVHTSISIEGNLQEPNTLSQVTFSANFRTTGRFVVAIHCVSRPILAPPTLDHYAFFVDVNECLPGSFYAAGQFPAYSLPQYIGQCQSLSSEIYQDDYLAEVFKGWPSQTVIEYPFNSFWVNNVLYHGFPHQTVVEVPLFISTTLRIERFLDEEQTQTEVVSAETQIAFHPIKGTTLETVWDHPASYSENLILPALEEEGVYLFRFRSVASFFPEPLAQSICAFPQQIESLSYLILHVKDRKNFNEKHQNEVGVSPQKAYGINPFTGAFTHSHTDLSIPGRGIDFNLVRIHDSNIVHFDFDSEFGYGWWSPYLQRLIFDEEVGERTEENEVLSSYFPIHYKTGEGRFERFALDEENPQKWITPKRSVFLDLSYDETEKEYTLTGEGEIKAGLLR